MLEVLPSPPHLVAVKVTERLEAEDIEAIMVAIEGALAELRKISVFIDLSAMQEVTFEAVKKDLSYAYQMLSHLGRYHRGAVVTDRDWIVAATRVEDFLLPGLDVRAFKPEHRDAAFGWAAEDPVEDPAKNLAADPAGEDTRSPASDAAPTAGLKILATDNSDVLALEVRGRMTTADLPAAERLFADLLAREKPVNLLVRASGYDGFDWDLVLRRQMLEKKLKAMGKIKLYALVDAPAWIGNLVRLTNPLTPMECRTFSKAQEADAWRWVGANPR
jgi:hypothetical protein|tara:strand:- start:1171 stop:1995 length:825 start_codon:yes stop_codon:yes gene_type:complete